MPQGALSLPASLKLRTSVPSSLYSTTCPKPGLSFSSMPSSPAGSNIAYATIEWPSSAAMLKGCRAPTLEGVWKWKVDVTSFHWLLKTSMTLFRKSVANRRLPPAAANAAAVMRVHGHGDAGEHAVGRVRKARCLRVVDAIGAFVIDTAVFARHALMTPSSVTKTNLADPDVPPGSAVGGAVECRSPAPTQETPRAARRRRWPRCTRARDHRHAVVGELRCRRA